MTRSFDTIREVMRRAREDEPPPVDVADRVMRRLAAAEVRAVPDESARILTWMAGASAALAVPAIILLITAWNTVTDPLTGLLFSFWWG